MDGPRVIEVDGFADPRVATTYDIENTGRDDVEWYVALAERLGASAVIDLGCGTGVLATELAARGLQVTGIDPAEAMLDVARARPGGDRVAWITGDASAMADASASLVVMSGHVAQVFITDEAWAATLVDVRRALRDGGHVAFETRNPAARAWTSWTRGGSFATWAPDGGRSFSSWVEVTGVADGVVAFDAFTRFADTGETLVAHDRLRFRSLNEVEGSLLDAGFATPAVSGDWDGSPVTSASPELIVVAPVAGRPNGAATA